MTFQAIYENGVFRPTQAVHFAEHALVTLDAAEASGTGEDATGPGAEAEAYRIMALRFDSGDPHGAERHDEHQP